MGEKFGPLLLPLNVHILACGVLMFLDKLFFNTNTTTSIQVNIQHSYGHKQQQQLQIVMIIHQVHQEINFTTLFPN